MSCGSFPATLDSNLPRTDSMNRGLERRNIVLDDDDRAIWWSLFERVARRCGWRVFAVALLDNHFHIYLRTPQPNLSDGMRDLDGGYASVFNQRHDRALNVR